jgi:hypothetical protein
MSHDVMQAQLNNCINSDQLIIKGKKIGIFFFDCGYGGHKPT